MHGSEDFFVVAFVWMAFMAVACSWMARIAWLLVRQRQAERLYRHRLAVSMGAAARESRREART